ncbi:MAG TPA: Lrp/AsnC family transcriptional regulator [Ktedonosporobacter sp.]|nr:Lrp/AsnC family transcriptional regulator [Ktedonosporobacter sp.]
MSLEIEKLLDETGWHLLQELQQNARLSYSELGQRVGLSSPSVADRIRKMEEADIITGYHAEVNLTKLGLPMLALIRLGSNPGQSCNHAVAQVNAIPEVLECYKVTGADCAILKVVAASVDHLEKIIEQISQSGPASTSLVFSKPMKRHTITHELLERAEPDVPN